jgi:hypothetical protein
LPVIRVPVIGDTTKKNLKFGRAARAMQRRHANPSPESDQALDAGPQGEYGQYTPNLELC